MWDLGVDIPRPARLASPRQGDEGGPILRGELRLAAAMAGYQLISRPGELHYEKGKKRRSGEGAMRRCRLVDWSIGRLVDWSIGGLVGCADVRVTVCRRDAAGFGSGAGRLNRRDEDS